MTKYLQFLFENIPEEKKELIIALLSEEGFDGFEETDSSVKTFIEESKFNTDKFDELIQLIGAVPVRSVVEDENWNAKWESDFEPVKVLKENGEPFAFVRAGFHEADHSFPYDIEVTPKMSFGTGHHATTYMMVSQMAEIDFTGKTVIDFGTGTGVLAILAEKLGAASILAIDCDDWSIENAKENTEKNHCSRIKLMKAETIPAGNTADIILANINLNIILENFQQIMSAAKPGTIILFSGIMEHDGPQIEKAIRDRGLQLKNITKRNNWLALKVEG